MKVVIVGAGSVGRYMAAQLAGSGHRVTVIEKDLEVVRKRSGSSTGFELHAGDGCEVATLRHSGCADADVVAAVTGDDEDNLVVSLLAKQEFAVPRVVARVNNPSNEWMFNEMWGVDVAVSTPHLLTGLVEEAVNVGTYVRLMSLERGKARVAEVTLTTSSPACGIAISEAALPREAAVVALVRDAHVVTPSADTILRAGDEVIVLLTGDAEDAVRAALVGT
jgi:trk system potassium uptake protein TrkA